MKVFVTGDKGFIGTNLTKKFQDKGISFPDYQNNEKKRIDILEKDQFSVYWKDVDAIIHLAAKTSITNSINNPYETILY